MAKKRKAAKKSVTRRKPSKSPQKSATGAPMKASFTLRPQSTDKPRSRDATDKAVRQIVRQAESSTGLKSQGIKVYPNIDSFAVSGAPELIESLEKHRDVAARLPEASSEDMLIRPVRKQVVHLKGAQARRPKKK